MIFTQKQSKDFIQQLYSKKQIQTAIESTLKSLTLQLHLPVSIVNSGSKRVYEALFNSMEFEKNYTVTTSSVQVSLGNITMDAKQNTGPSETYIFLKSGNIPYKFSTASYQKVLNMKLDCQLISSNAIEALQNIEYIIDNLSFAKVFSFKSMGVQFQASYGLYTTDLDGNPNKLFDYGNSENTVSIDFTIELEIVYLAYRTANLIKYIIDHTSTVDNPNPNDNGNPPLDTETGGSPSLGAGDGFIVTKFVGTVATVKPVDLENDLFDIDGGTWYHSDNITEEDLIKSVRVKDIDDANKSTS